MHGEWESASCRAVRGSSRLTDVGLRVGRRAEAQTMAAVLRAAERASG